MGGGRRRAAPGCCGRPAPTVTTEYYFNDAGSQIDRFARSLLAAAQRRAGARGRLRRASTSPTSPRRSSAKRPDALDAARRRGAGGLPGRGRRADVRRDQVLAGRVRRAPSTSTSTRRTCTTAASSTRRWTGCASRATSSRPTARSGCGPPTSATTRTGCCVKQQRRVTYFAADCAYYLDKRERGFDRVVIMLGADHHGYVGRMRAMAACFGDDPDQQPRDPHRTAGEPGPGRAAGADEQAGRHRRSRSRTWSTRSASTRPGTRWPATRPTRRSTSTSTCGPGPRNDNPVHYVQYAHARIAVVAAQRGRARASTAGRRLRPGAARPRAGERPAQGARRVPGGGRHRGRAAGAAPGRALPRGAGRRVPPVLRRLPGAAAWRRAGDRPAPGPAVARRGDPRWCSPTDWACSASPRPSGCRGDRCERMRPVRCTATSAPAARSGCGRPTTSTRCCRQLWPRTVTRADDGALEVGGVDVRELAAEFGTPAYVLDEADFRARCRDFRDGLRRRGRLLRGQGVLRQGGAADRRRGGAQPRRLHRRRAGGRAGRRDAAGADQVHGNNKSVAELRRALDGRRRLDRGRLVRRDRPADRAGPRARAYGRG